MNIPVTIRNTIPGDLIRCIDNKGVTDDLIIDKIYKVVNICVSSSGYVVVDIKCNRYLFASRFVKVNTLPSNYKGVQSEYQDFSIKR